MHERRGTGGGPSKAPRLSKIEELAFESIPRTIIVGLQCGVDSNSPPNSEQQQQQRSPNVSDFYLDPVKSQF